MIKYNKGSVFMRCLFLINPSSGTKTIQKKLDQLIGQMILKKIINHVDVFYTQKKHDAYHRVLEIQPHEYDFLVSVGGDGTVNEIISGIVEKEFDIPLAILPGGTVNDFANVIAGGMFSDISFQVTKAEKERFGPLAYYISGIRQLPSQLSTTLHLKVKTENEEFEEDARLFMITNTSQVGGFKAITPHADIQDGQLDLLIIKKCSTTDMLSLFKDYKLSTHEKSPFIRYVQAHEITIECDKNIIYDIDGEEGTHFPIHVTTKNKALCIIVP